MKAIQRILLALDTSEVAEDARREAFALAKVFGSEITLCHAVLPPEYSPDLDKDSFIAFTLFDRVKAEGGKEGVAVNPTFTIRAGTSAEVILGAAKEGDVDVIVLGAGSRTKLDRVLLGSTAEQVTREAEVPVWLVRPGRPQTEFRRILCAVDSSDPAREALASAIFLARTFVSKLHLLTVAGEKHEDEELLGEKQAKLRACMQAFNLHGIEVEFEVRSGKPAVEILEAVQEDGSDLLVVGSAGRKGLSRLLHGNTAEKLLRAAPCSLLTVHSKRV